MVKETFYNILSDEEALRSLPLADLQQLVLRFPYFQAARILLLKKMKDEENLAFDRELKKSAVFIGDRAKLYVYLHAFSSGIVMSEALPELSLVTTGGEQDDSVSASYTGSESTTFNYLFLSEEEAQVVNQREVLNTVGELVGEAQGASEVMNNDWGLIDQFMNSGNKKITADKAEFAPKGNLAESSVQENSAILTETLANIYIKQNKYDKAIAIFESLSLKIPEKSAYFAARIKELEILIKSS